MFTLLYCFQCTLPLVLYVVMLVFFLTARPLRRNTVAILEIVAARTALQGVEWLCGGVV